MSGADRQLARLVGWLDAFAEHTGRAISWLTLVMVALVMVVVVLRYAFGIGWVQGQEAAVWAHAMVFMLGAAYTLKHDEHVRVDVFYRGASPRFRAWVDLFGVVFLLSPVCVFIILSSYGYVASSWRVGEASREAGGLPALYLLKTAIPLMGGLVLFQGLSQALRSVLVLRGVELERDRHAGGEGV